MRQSKLFVGRKLRAIREDQGLTQAKFAEILGISTSYLNQIENSQRHITAPVLIALAEQFGTDVAMLSDSDSDRLLVDLAEVFSDTKLDAERPTQSELKLVAANAPTIAQTLISLHQSLKKTSEQITELGHAASDVELGTSPYEEVRDFFHYQNNYIDALDHAGEALAAKIAEPSGLPALEHYLSTEHAISVEYIEFETPGYVRVFDQLSKTLRMSRYLSSESRRFHMAHTIAHFEHRLTIEHVVKEAGFRSTDAASIASISLANYFAGAVVLPYELFIKTAEDLRFDLHLLSAKFGASIEQVAHRLSTLQRPGRKGLPFFFARVDRAGNITKRHSAARLQFARFGSACPLWNVHSAFETPDRIQRQLAQTPDGEKYLCLALAKTKHIGGYQDPVQNYALALGCSISHADKLVYADGLNTSSDAAFEPIGISCRLCDRENCHQRSVPPMQRRLRVDPNLRPVVPFELG